MIEYCYDNCTYVLFLSSGYEYREDECVSSMLEKAVQQMHRFAGSLQTIEYEYDICKIYLERFGSFPSCGSIEQPFDQRCKDKFVEIFPNRYSACPATGCPSWLKLKCSFFRS